VVWFMVSLNAFTPIENTDKKKRLASNMISNMIEFLGVLIFFIPITF
jgi:hypothetical protein